MSIKTELQSNNVDIQSLIDIANALPDIDITNDIPAEDIDSELSAQDDLIAQITAALEYKAVPRFKAICFSIDETYYPAEKGMTWEEWCESEYNTIGCYINSYVYASNGEYYITSTASPMSGSRKIEANEVCITMPVNGDW